MSGDNATFESEEYTVGWVCALPLEMAAARGMLDKIHPKLAQQDPDDHNSYILGEIQGHKIAIACLPAGIYGINPAATVAKDLLRTFKSIRFGLLVGIGGGAPSPQHDIRLGDVVISQPSGTSGGVVQHDRGKILPEGRFQRTGSQYTPPQILLSALSCLQATHMTEESRVPEFLSQLNAKTSKRMKGKFSYPGILNDRLYQAEYDHVNQGNATCVQCDESKIINRGDRGDTDPYFHYGIIASGNQVIKEGKTRERLSQEYGALCFEMEAAGLYNFPCLVIRGICDYADSHKNKNWQQYAAATAAAFATELLLFVPPSQVLQEKKLVSELVSITKTQLETSVQSLNEQKHLRKILDDRPLDLHIVHNARYDSEDVKKSPRCEPGTRIRILELIQNWADQDSGLPLLWLIGPAGTGKSTVARSMIDALDIKNRLVAGYMFKRGEQDRNDTHRLFSTLAMQLADTVSLFKQSLRNSLEGLDKEAVDKSSLENQFQKLLWDPLESLRLKEANQLPRIIIIDALDECERLESLPRLLGLLSKLCTASTPQLRVLITSRYAPEIVEAFKPLLQNKTVHTLELHREFCGDTILDIRHFLEARFADIKNKRRVQKDPWPSMKDLDRLVRLSTTPEPSFIYAASLCRFVSDMNRGPIQQLIMWLEQGSKSQLHQIYSPILDQAFYGFDEEEFRQKLRFLGIIALLSKPLSAKSLTLLLRTNLDDISWWVPRLYAVLHVPSELGQPIQLLHKSFADFLTSDEDSGCNKYRINTAEIHAIIAQACIRCMEAKLKQDICEVQKPGTAKNKIDRKLIHSCIPAELEYACTYWFLHLKRSGQPLSFFTYTFVYDHLLHWIEVLSLLGRLADGVSILRELLEIGQACNDLRHDFVPFVQDSIRVIVAFITLIELAPLQIYGSSIFFSPTRSIVRQRFWHQRMPKTGEIHGVESHWSARLQVIQNSGRAVHLQVFSPNGHFLASVVEDGCREQEIQLRNIVTTNLYALSLTWSSVEAMAFSANNRHLGAADFDGHIILWDVKSGHTQEIEIACSRPLAAIRFSSDLNLVISVSKDGTVQYWERLKNVYQEIASKRLNVLKATGEIPFSSERYMTGVWLVWATFSPCMQLLAYQTPDNPGTQVWDFATSRHSRLYRRTRHIVGLARFSPDSMLLALVCDQMLTISDVRTGVQKLSLVHDHPVDAIAFSPCGWIIASSARERIQLRYLKTGFTQATLIEDGTVSALAFSPDGSILASHQHLWDATEARDYVVSNQGSHCITKIASSPDGQLIASASRDNAIQVWDAPTLVPRWRSVCDTKDILELCFSSDSKLLASLSEDKRLYVWDMIFATPQETFHSSISDVAYSPDGQTVATIDWLEFGGEVALRETATGTCLRILDSAGDLVKGDEIGPRRSMKVRKPFEPPQFTSKTRPSSRIIFSPDGHNIAAIRSPGSLHIWETSTGRQHQSFSINSRVRKIIFSPDSQLIAVLVDFRVLLWRINTSKPLHTLSVEAKTAEFSSDGRLLVLAGTEITVWDVATGFRQHTLGDLEGDPTALCVASDGKRIAVSSRDQPVRLRSVTSNPATHFIPGREETVTTMAFASDGKALVTASKHGLIRLWDMSSGTQSRWIIRQEGTIRGIRLLPNELIVSVSDPPPFLNLWNDIKLRIHRYRTPSITTEQVLGRVTCNMGLGYDGNWIVQGSENLLWVPPQYRPTDGSVKGWVSRDPATIFIGSVSSNVIGFQIV